MEILLGKVDKTARGFQIIHFRDYSNRDCSLQQSSMAIYEPPGTSAVWLGVGDERMNLELEQVKALIEALQNWVGSGTFDKEWGDTITRTEY